MVPVRGVASLPLIMIGLYVQPARSLLHSVCILLYHLIKFCLEISQEQNPHKATQSPCGRRCEPEPTTPPPPPYLFVLSDHRAVSHLRDLRGQRSGAGQPPPCQ